ncbi:hypothetical protein [Candidatus Palauibacter sp.]|uniref:hypothetical protein n=1 Tax=Candidatus Palauibacter sp. TaxID=3101350 RepID=UPI003B012AA9
MEKPPVTPAETPKWSVTLAEPRSVPWAGLPGPPEIMSAQSLCAATADGMASATIRAPAKAHAAAGSRTAPRLLPLVLIILTSHG